MKGKTALFLAFVSLLFGCPPGGESGTVTLGDVSVTPVRGYNTTATFELKAAVQTNVEATLTIVVKDETGAEAANSGAMKVKAGNSTQTFSTKIEKFGNMKATFTLAAAGVETQTKSVDFEVLEGGVPSAEFGWPATGVYAGARITISMKDVKADTAGTGEGTFEFSQAAFTMKKEDGTPVNIDDFPKLEDNNLNTDFQIDLPSEHGNYSITLSVTNTNEQTREKTVDFTLADKVNVASITAEPSSFSDLIVNDTVKVTLTFTGEGEQTPSDINVNWDEGSNYSVELVEQTATTAVYNLTVLSSSLSTATATAADGSGKTVSVTFSDISGNKVPATKTIEGRTLNLAYVENFNNIEKVLEKWRADGWREGNTLKRFYWRPEALEMTEFEGRQVFTMFTRKWGSRPGEDTTKTPYYPGQDQSSSNGNNQAGEQWIAGGIHLQDNIVFGYMEARVRTDRNSNKQWDAFWSYDTSGGTSPIEYEFDIMEAITHTELDVTTHFWKGGRFWTSPSTKHGKVNGGVDLNNDWYTLGLYWTPEEVIYYGYHGDTPIALAGIKSDYTLTHGYAPGSRDPKEGHPFISRWEQGFKFTTELGEAYGGTGRPTTEEKYYIDYFAYYHIPVSQAVLADGIQNGTAAFDRTKAGNNASAWADIASEGNPIYVTVTPDNGYTVSGVTATWTGGSKELQKVDGEENRWMLIVDANMPQYYDFDAQDYGDPVTITPTFTASTEALESVELNPEALIGIGGTTVTVNYTPDPSNAVINDVTVSEGYTYDKETKLLTLKNNDGSDPVEETVTFTFTTVDSKTKQATLSVTIYPDTYVQRNGVFYEPVKTVDDFSSTAADVEITNSASASEGEGVLDAWNRTSSAAVITVNSLPAEASADKLTINNIGSDSTDKANWLMEMTLTYSQDGNNFRGMIFFAPDSSDLDRPWFLMRNSFNGKVGQGMAFRVGPNSEDASSKYTFEGGQELNLGFLFNGATQGETAYFFFNGETKPIPIDHASISTTKAPAITDNSITLRFGKDAADNGTITLKKIVFYKPVDAAQ